jgi:hypothetical protein
MQRGTLPADTLPSGHLTHDGAAPSINIVVVTIVNHISFLSVSLSHTHTHTHTHAPLAPKIRMLCIIALEPRATVSSPDALLNTHYKDIPLQQQQQQM